MNQPVFGQLFWRRNDPGWYKHPTLGSIHREWGEWFWYPYGRHDNRKNGPHRTLKSAIEWAERKGRNDLEI